MKRFALLVLFLALVPTLLTCGEGTMSTGPVATQTAEVSVSVPQTRAEPASQVTISDGVHNAGNPHFFFRPPLAPDPGAQGTFDAQVQPAVNICELGGDVCVGPLVAHFSVNSGAGNDRVRADLEEEQYVVNWQAQKANLRDGAVYRIWIEVPGVVLGYANVTPGTTGDEMLVLGTGETIALKGGSLPIKFRIEEGALPAELIIHSGNEQAGLIGEPLKDPVVLVVLNRDGVPLPGVSLEAQVGEGAGAIREHSPSDAEGLTTLTWQLGQRGEQAAVVSLVSGGPSSAQLTAWAMKATNRLTASALHIDPNDGAVATFELGNGELIQFFGAPTPVGSTPVITGIARFAPATPQVADILWLNEGGYVEEFMLRDGTGATLSYDSPPGVLRAEVRLPGGRTLNVSIPVTEQGGVQAWRTLTSPPPQSFLTMVQPGGSTGGGVEIQSHLTDPSTGLLNSGVTGASVRGRFQVLRLRGDPPSGPSGELSLSDQGTGWYLASYRYLLDEAPPINQSCSLANAGLSFLCATYQKAIPVDGIAVLAACTLAAKALPDLGSDEEAAIASACALILNTGILLAGLSNPCQYLAVFSDAICLGLALVVLFEPDDINQFSATISARKTGHVCSPYMSERNLELFAGETVHLSYAFQCPRKPATIIREPSAASILAGATANLGVRVLDLAGEEIQSLPVRWESNNTSIVQVLHADGQQSTILGVSPGETNVWAHAGDETAGYAADQFTISVSGPPTGTPLTFSGIYNGEFASPQYGNVAWTWFLTQQTLPYCTVDPSNPYATCDVVTGIVDFATGSPLESLEPCELRSVLDPNTQTTHVIASEVEVRMWYEIACGAPLYREFGIATPGQAYIGAWQPSTLHGAGPQGSNQFFSLTRQG